MPINIHNMSAHTNYCSNANTILWLGLYDYNKWWQLRVLVYELNIPVTEERDKARTKGK